MTKEASISYNVNCMGGFIQILMNIVYENSWDSCCISISMLNNISMFAIANNKLFGMINIVVREEDFLYPALAAFLGEDKKVKFKDSEKIKTSGETISIIDEGKSIRILFSNTEKNKDEDYIEENVDVRFVSLFTRIIKDYRLSLKNTPSVLSKQ